MNARQRRRERRIDARISAGIGRGIEAHFACKAAMVEVDRAAVKSMFAMLCRDMLPPELQRYAPSVEWR